MTETEAWLAIRDLVFYARFPTRETLTAAEVFEHWFYHRDFPPTKKRELAIRLLRAIREEDHAQYCCVVDDLMELAKKPEGFMSREEMKQDYEFRIKKLQDRLMQYRESPL